MNSFFEVSKQVKLAASGGPGSVVVVNLPTSEPYRDYTAWFIGTISSGGNVTAQPILTTQDPSAGSQVQVNDGNQTTLTSADPFYTKLAQQASGELRPQSQGMKASPGDDVPSPVMMSAVKFTNNSANPESFWAVLCAVSAERG